MLRTRLQSALKEGMELLERVQSLESDKASLEEQLSRLQEELSKAVRRSCE